MYGSKQETRRTTQCAKWLTNIYHLLIPNNALFLSKLAKPLLWHVHGGYDIAITECINIFIKTQLIIPLLTQVNVIMTLNA